MMLQIGAILTQRKKAWEQTVVSAEYRYKISYASS